MPAAFLFVYLQYDAKREGVVIMAKKRKRSEARILADVAAIIDEYGGEALGLQANAVAVKGDARQYGPTVMVRLSANVDHERRAELSTLITNQVPEITRVLVDCLPNPS